MSDIRPLDEKEEAELRQAHRFSMDHEKRRCPTCRLLATLDFEREQHAEAMRLTLAAHAEMDAALASRPEPRHRFDCDCPCHTRLSGICRDCLAASRPEPGADLARILHEERVGCMSVPVCDPDDPRYAYFHPALAARLAARGVTVSPNLAAGVRRG